MCQWHACRLLSLLKTIPAAFSSLGEHYAAPPLWLVVSIFFNTAVLFSDVSPSSFLGSPTHFSRSPVLCGTPPTPRSFDMADWKFLFKMCFFLFLHQERKFSAKWHFLEMENVLKTKYVLLH